MQPVLPLSLKIAAVLAAIACMSFLIFLIGGQIYGYAGWPVGWWPDLIFESLTAISWFSAFGAIVMTLIGTYATRRLLISLKARLELREK